jgi:hypothetical protein
MAQRPVIELRRGRSWKRAVAWALDGTPFAVAAWWIASWLGADPALLIPALTALALAGFVYQLLCHWLLGASGWPGCAWSAPTARGPGWAGAPGAPPPRCSA